MTQNDSSSRLACRRARKVRKKTYRDPIIPKRDIPLAPLEPNMNLRTRAHNLIQQRDNRIAFRLGHADNLGHEAWVEKHALPACDGVRADQGVFGCDGLAAHGA